MSYNLRNPVVAKAPEVAPRQGDVGVPPSVSAENRSESDLRTQRREQRAAEKERRASTVLDPERSRATMKLLYVVDNYIPVLV